MTWLDVTRAAVRGALVVLLSLLCAGSARAQKADSVRLRNGDQITGEVKSLSLGLLKYSTDDLGTVYIEWDKVTRISTVTVLEVQRRSGDKVYGRLRQGPVNGTIVLGDVTIPLSDIVTLTPIEGKLLARLNGYVDIGFSYQKSHSTVQLNNDAMIRYRGPTTETAMQITTFFENRDDAAETSRLSTAFTERFLLPHRYSTGVVIGYDQNNELDLAGRSRVVGFGARTLAETNRIQFRVTGGLVVQRERYLSTDSTSSGVEALAGASFRAFRYDRPKLDVSMTSEAFPSLTIRGRVRWQNDIRASYELKKDFMLSVTLFDSFDSKPQSADAPRNDFGTTFAIGWSF